jgi:ribosome-associated protein
MPNTEHILRTAHDELQFDYVRSAGPGGQNVNKVATTAQLRFDVLRSSALPEPAKQRLKRLAGRRMTGEGVLVIEARRYRTQEQNRADALARFDELLGRALQEPKRRVPTKATLASRERRLQSKRKKSDVKRKRQDRSFEA